MLRREISPQTRRLASLLTHPSTGRLDELDPGVLDTADAHGVMPLLSEAIRAAGLLDRVSPAIRARLISARREAFALDVVGGAHANLVTRCLAAEGIEAVTFKGAALAQTHYESSWLRPRGDVDLLVHPSQVALAGGVLERLGCRRVPRPEGALVTSQARYAAEPSSVEVAYDLHWRLFDPQVFGDSFDYATIRAAAVPGASEGQWLAGPVHAMLIACIHRAAHHEDTDRLLLLYDTDRLARRFTAEDWSAFVQEGRRAAVCAVCLRGLELARSLLETPVPDSVAQVLAAAGDTEPSAVFASRPMRRIDILQSDLAVLGWGGRATLLAEHVFPPRSYVAARYGTDCSSMLPILYAHRLVGGLAAWLRRPVH